MTTVITCVPAGMKGGSASCSVVSAVCHAVDLCIFSDMRRASVRWSANGGDTAGPVAIADLAEDRVIARHQGPLAQLGAVVAGVRVGDHLARVVPGGQGGPEEL